MDERKSFRCKVFGPAAEAELELGPSRLACRLLDESAGGFAALVQCPEELTPGTVGRLRHQGGWFEPLIQRSCCGQCNTSSNGPAITTTAILIPPTNIGMFRTSRRGNGISDAKTRQLVGLGAGGTTSPSLSRPKRQTAAAVCGSSAASSAFCPSGCRPLVFRVSAVRWLAFCSSAGRSPGFCRPAGSPPGANVLASEGCEAWVWSRGGWGFAVVSGAGFSRVA